MIAPKVFDIDDDNKVVLLDDDPSEDQREQVEHARMSCPKSAIAVD